MRITLFFLFFSVLYTQATIGYSQGVELTLELRSASIKEICDEIEKQSDFRFIFAGNAKSIINREAKLTVDSEEIDKILDDIFSNTQLVYKILDNQIVVYQDETKNIPNEIETTISKLTTQQQKKQITGKIIDGRGEPIIGANIIETGTTNGTVTDLEGNFSLYIEDNAVMRVTYIGYLEQEINTANQQTFNITLLEDTQALDELVVVGYGSIRKGNIATSITSVDAEVIQNRSVHTVGEAIQGLVPGLDVISSGRPGSTPSISLRGATSLNDVGTPLVLVDGVPSDFNFLNPEDIESINVLKDAASSAIYGSRAANGVILVTTKRGKLGKPMFSYNGSVGVNTPTALPKPLGSADFARHYNVAMINEGGAPIYTDEMISMYENGTDPYNYPNTNWFDLALENTNETRHSIEVSGGTENVRYLVSGGWNRQTGIIPENTQNVFNTRSSTDITVTDKFNFSFDMRYQLRKLDQLPNVTDVYKSVYGSDPTSVAYAQNGEYAYNPVFFPNPLVRIYEGSKEYNDMHDVAGIFKFDYEIMNGLKFTGLANANYAMTEANTRNPIHRYKYLFEDGYFESGENSLSERRQSKAYYNLQALLNYQKTFEKHGIDALFGYQQENQRDEWISASRAGYPTDILWVLDAGPKEKWQNGGNAEHWALASFLGRINYDYEKKYMLTISFRSDASSRFAKENRWSTFPSLAAAWRLSSEEFMVNTQSWMDDMKIRISWGQTGSSTGVGLYPSYTTIQMNQAVVDYTWMQTAMLRTIGNIDLGWERTEMLDLGVDVILLDNRLGVTLDYYIKNTKDILIGLPVPLEYGFGNPNMNVGKMRNRGWEFLVNWNDAIGDVNYGITGTLSDNRNEVTDLAGTGPWISGYTDVGLPFNSYYGFESLGLFQSEEEVENAPFQTSLTQSGDIRYRDQNGDGKIDANDRVVLGDRYPHYLFGLDLNANYKGFDFRIFFQGIGKKNVIITDQAVRPFSDSPISEHQLDYWTPENMDAKYPRILLTSAHNYSISDFWKINGGYFRCKNVQVGYSLPKTLVNSIGLSQVRVYVTANNLFTLSNYVPGYDPEISAAFSYPLAKTFAAGLNIQF